MKRWEDGGQVERWQVPQGDKELLQAISCLKTQGRAMMNSSVKVAVKSLIMRVRFYSVSD
jgi:hypothetical protein